MSFSSRTKNELCRLPRGSDCCCTAELMGIICFAGEVKQNKEEMILRVSTENASVARRFFSLVKWVFGVQAIVNIRKKKTPKHANSYNLYLKDRDTVEKVLLELGLVNSDTYAGNSVVFRINQEITAFNCCKRAFLRGAFLGGGSITDPEKSYHLELVTHHYLLNKDLYNILQEFGFDAKTVLRKSNYVTYFKGSENIVDFLNIIGAHKSLMALENIRIVKEMRNNVNRMVNCETANLEKTVSASVKQIDSIQFIDKTIGLGKLPKALQEIAQLRMEHREASLKELGEMLNPPIGKSGVNHRLRKLCNIAENIKNGNLNVKL
ncbi:MAG: DNA-binding protein WhiA [Clostridiaceae bacterium]|nr:DNA-binding protein WhiA [Clostridiaceae bacterium]